MTEDVGVDRKAEGLNAGGAYDTLHVAFGKRTGGQHGVKGRMVTGRNKSRPMIKLHNINGIDESLGKRNKALCAAVSNLSQDGQRTNRLAVEPEAGLAELHELTYSQACIEHYQSKGVVADSPVLLLGCSILAEQHIEEKMTLLDG